MRTVGVEEELLLVDVESGQPRSVSARILRHAETRDDNTDDADEQGDEPGGSLGHEVQQQQLETDTPPHTDMAALHEDIRMWRDKAVLGARKVGARVIASGTSPVPVQPRVVPKPRFKEMVEHFGLTITEQLTCGCHVHVSVSSEDEAVAVLDRIRVWLPSLLALSANSPFWQGSDSSYASFRSQAMIRWPTAGPCDVFGSADNYRKLVADMVESGVIADQGMVYFDARLSHSYPTIEIRTADVCLDARDTVLIAALSRALVETASRQWEAEEPSPEMSTSMLRLAMWQAGRDGVEGKLLDPYTARARPAREVLTELVDHVRAALRDTGDEKLVDDRIEEILSNGTGATRQRAMLERTGQLVDVVADLARVTEGRTD